MRKIIVSVIFLLGNVALALGLTEDVMGTTGIITNGVYEKDLSPKAQRLYKNCIDGNTAAIISSCDELSKMFSRGNGVPESYDASDIFAKIAFEKTWKNCENGDIKSCDSWLRRCGDSLCSLNGSYSSEIIYAEEKTCRGGMPHDCFSLGQRYENNHEYKKAIEFYSIGCDYTHEESCKRLKNLQ